MQALDNLAAKSGTIASVADWLTSGYGLTPNEVALRVRRTAGAALLAIVAYGSGTVIALAAGALTFIAALCLALLALLLCVVAGWRANGKPGDE